MALQRRVEDALLQCGVIADRERFTPHLTLARVRDDAPSAARRALGAKVTDLADEEQARLTVSGISLVQSTLTPQGSHYTELRTAPLL